MPYQTRTLNYNDLKQLIDLDEIGMFQKNDTPPLNPPPHLSLTEVQAAYNKGNVFRGFFIEDKLIAYIWFELKKSSIYIDSIVVHLDHRKKGLGTSLLNYVEEIAHKHDSITQINATTDPFNYNSLYIFFKLGYKVIDYKINYFGENYPNVNRLWLEKSLNAHNKIYTLQSVKKNVKLIPTIEK